MYERTIKKIIKEQFQCDHCGKTAEFVTEMFWGVTDSREPTKTTKPDYGTWSKAKGHLYLYGDADQAAKELPFDATYCSPEHKKEAIKAAIATATPDTKD